MASVRGMPPEDVTYDGEAASLQLVWIAVRSSLRQVVENVTLADIAGGKLPKWLPKLADQNDAWVTR